MDSGSDAESEHLEALFTPQETRDSHLEPAGEWAFSGGGPEARHTLEERRRQLDDSDLRVQFAQADLDNRRDLLADHQQE